MDRGLGGLKSAKSFARQKHTLKKICTRTVTRRLPGSSSKHLLQAELDYRGKFLKHLNDMASKDVHGSVALAEAKQGLVGLYFFLFNLSQCFTRNDDPT